MVPCRCAKSSASAVSRVSRTASSIGKLPLARDSVAQGLALDVRHGEPEMPAGVARIEDGEDVRMLESCGELDLAKEALGSQARRQLGMEHLERHRPLVPEVLGEEDGGHAAAPELALDRVAIRQRLAQLRPTQPSAITLHSSPFSFLISPFTALPPASGTAGSSAADRTSGRS